MKNLVLLVALSTILFSCKKDDVKEPVNPPNATSLGELTFNQDFNWSSSLKGNVDVSIISDTSIFSVDGQELLIMDNSDKVLGRQFIDGKSASFYISKPQVNQSVYLYLPATGDKMELTGIGNVEFQVKSNFFDIDFQNLADLINSGKTKMQKGKVSAANLVVNGDFETNDFGIYGSNITLGKWYVKNNNSFNWQNGNGGKVFQSDHNNNGYAYQLLDVSGGELFTVSAVCSKNFAIVAFYFDASDNYISYNAFLDVNGSLSGSGSIPNQADYILLKIHGNKNEWIDDVSFATAPAVVDTDNDGISDDNDDFPNDASRAFTSYFPTAGYQTLAFEDLWPAKGDYDFNDMVVTNNVVYTHDAANNLVNATFTISLDAVGSGFANGLAIVFTDNNKQFIANNIISNVSGDATQDPGITNGVIVFPHVFNAQSQYYKNDGVGPSATADVFTFTVNFNSNVSGLTIIPDVFIYRSSERGLEVHLDGFSGTSAANTSYNNTVDDVNGTYSTTSGLPWAIEIVTPDKGFHHPLEKVDILVAYPQFQNWAESNGSNNQNWWENPVSQNIFDGN